MQSVISVMGRSAFTSLVPLIIDQLTSINKNAQDYFYYMTPCPWLQVKLLKLLQLFAPPSS